MSLFNRFSCSGQVLGGKRGEYLCDNCEASLFVQQFRDMTAGRANHERNRAPYIENCGRIPSDIFDAYRDSPARCVEYAVVLLNVKTCMDDLQMSSAWLDLSDKALSAQSSSTVLFFFKIWLWTEHII